MKLDIILKRKSYLEKAQKQIKSFLREKKIDLIAFQV